MTKWRLIVEFSENLDGTGAIIEIVLVWLFIISRVVQLEGNSDRGTVNNRRASACVWSLKLLGSTGSFAQGCTREAKVC